MDRGGPCESLSALQECLRDTGCLRSSEEDTEQSRAPEGLSWSGAKARLGP